MTSEMKVRLFPGGPEFPADFLDLIQKGRVVFFCGAGLSVGTGLPDFSGLVQELDEIMNPDPNDRFESGRTDYDRMLSELESRFAPKRMRKHVRRILSKPPESEMLENHRNILKLAATSGGGLRLVTTNFDDRFARASDREIPFDDAPKLPGPESAGWSSLVHLHGRICEGGDLNNLVLNASDFGRAYLSEGWARRFVIHLMRCWSIAFVGYGLNDPPMRYLMDAVYDPRTSAEEFHRAFALVGYEAGEEGEQRLEWEEKRVAPILYNNADDYKALGEILSNLVRLKDESGYRAELAIKGVDKNPDDENGDNGRRVIWALRGSIAAKEFSEEKTLTAPKDEYRFVRWLDVFKENGLFDADNVASVRALDYPPRFAPFFRSPARHLTDWAARHTHQPSLLRWLAGQGESMHPHFVHKLHDSVVKSGMSMPEALRELWWIFLQSHPVDSGGIDLLEKRAYDVGELPPNARAELGQRILSALRPFPVLAPSGQSAHAYQDTENFGVCVRIGCELLRCPYGGRGEYILGELEKKSSGFAMKHAESLSAYLGGALSVMAWHEMSSSDLDCLLPEADDKRPSHHEYRRNYWKSLARMVRNAVRELVAEKQHRRLANLIAQWAESKHPLLWRMALYAAAESAKHFPEFREGGNWGAKILVMKCEVLWGWGCRPECLRFLRRAGGTITSSELSELECAILKGPPEEFRAGFDGIPDKAIFVRMARLAKKATLSLNKSMDLLATLQSEFPGVDLGKKGEYESPFGEMGSLTIVPREDKLACIRPDMLPEECADMIQKNCMEGGHWPASCFVENDLERAVATYEVLATRNIWDGVNWGDFLAALADQRRIDDAKSERLLRMLGNAPDDFLSDGSFSIALVLKNVAKFRPFSEMENIWRKVWRACAGKKIDARREDGIIANAFMDPCGMLADIVVFRLSQEKYFGRFAGLLEEILESDASGHMHGRSVVAGCAAFLFSTDREWTKRRVMPMFAAEHPDSLHSWVEFLKRSRMSSDFAQAIKFEFIDVAKQADKFSNSIRRIFVSRVFYVCRHFPKVFSDKEQRRLVGNMKEKTRGALCEYLRFVISSDDDSAKRGDIWRKSVGPFLNRTWPEHASLKTPAMSALLGDIIIQTGDAFPDAVKWAEDFLSEIEFPVNSSSGSIIGALRKGNKETTGEIPGKFPEACLRFLHRIVNLEDGPSYQFLKLGDVLKRIGEAKPALRKRKEFRELKEALAK